MVVKYSRFEMPEVIAVEQESDSFARIVVEPFERGFGHTTGNSLRRVMLTSIEAPAITSVKIEGMPHEFMAIDGVIEDGINIVLNLKGALLRFVGEEAERYPGDFVVVSTTVDVTSEMLEAGGGQHGVTLGEIIQESDFQVVNPQHVIFTATKPQVRRIDLRISIGRGYVPAERQKIADRLQDEIVLDSAFSPVRLVNYRVEATRVGQDTDLDRLILEITTDGRITPREACSRASQIAAHHLDIFHRIDEEEVSFDGPQMPEITDRDALLSQLAQRMDDIELSARSANCLAGASIKTIGELVVLTEDELLRFKNFGKKSLSEIKARLHERGLRLGMDLSRFNINRDNVQAVLVAYAGELAATESEMVDEEAPEPLSIEGSEE